MARTPGRGRQKIAMERIEEEKARQVTFSKHRGGVFKKASELSILCGAERAIVIFSPAGRACSFGYPIGSTMKSLINLRRRVSIRLSFYRCKKRLRVTLCFLAQLKVLNLDQLQQLDSSMANIKTMLVNRLNELQMINSTSLPSYMPVNQMNSMYAMTSMSTIGVSNPMNSINPMTPMGTIGGSNPFEPQSNMRNAFMFPRPPPSGPHPYTSNASIFPLPSQLHPNTSGKAPMVTPFQPQRPSTSINPSIFPHGHGYGFGGRVSN